MIIIENTIMSCKDSKAEVIALLSVQVRNWFEYGRSQDTDLHKNFTLSAVINFDFLCLFFFYQT